MANQTQALANVPAAQLAAQVANWAAQLEFQKERMRLLELPEMQGKTQIEIDKLAFAKSQDAWQKAIQEASLTGTYQGQPTAQWLQQQAQLTGVLNGNQTLQGKLTDAQIAQMNQAMATQGRQIALDEAKFQDDKARFGLTFAQQQLNDAARNRQADAGLTGYMGGQTTLARDQFTADATGYVNGKATLARDQMNNQQAQQYLQLLSSLQGSPFKTMRVLGNTPNGLSDLVNAWAGQYAMGGLTGSGQAPGTPQFADLFNPTGQPGFTGTSPVPPGTPPGAVPPPAPLPGAPGGPVAPLSPQEQARFQQLIARQQQLQAAGEPVPPADADELARFMARGAIAGPPAPVAPGAPTQPAPAPGSYLSPQEQARYQQLVARSRQLAAAGEPIPPADAAEQAAFEARGAKAPDPGPGQGPIAPGLDPSLGIAPHGPIQINEPTTPGPQPLSAQEQARYEQIIARQRQLAAAGQPLPPEDRAEAASYEARLGMDPGQQVQASGGGAGGYPEPAPPTLQSMAGYGITPATAPGYTYSPPGTQAPANAWNYQATPSGGTQTYPPGVTAPVYDHQVSTMQAQPMSTAGNMAAGATPGYQSGLADLTPLSPNQINAKNYGNTNKVGQDLMWQYFEDQQGYAPGAAQDAFMKSLPRYGGPAKGRVTAGLGF